MDRKRKEMKIEIYWRKKVQKGRKGSKGKRIRKEEIEKNQRE